VLTGLVKKASKTLGLGVQASLAGERLQPLGHLSTAVDSEGQRAFQAELGDGPYVYFFPGSTMGPVGEKTWQVSDVKMTNGRL
jgi:hypothetical protein